ncbi:MAG: hypothetical protein K0R28_5161 [Paenibacillus sp.]|jgi:AraC-like DNA-binding protein|nr:hypothetical protein [Paenibacillus sp.]
MGGSGDFFEYPLCIYGPTEYWKAKLQFKFPVSRDSIWTMIAVEDGRFSFTIGSIPGVATAGDIVLCPPQTEFCREMIDPLSFFYSRFRYRGAGAAEEERIVHLLRNLYGYKFTTPEQDRLSNNYRNLLAVYGKEDWSSRRWTTHFVSDIWSLFCMQAESLVQFGNIVHDPLMKAAKSRIEHHAFQNVQMKDIAVQFDLHPVQFTRRFQKVFGVSPSRYLFSIRMEKAKSLLIQTDYTLDHVAQLCGYDNGYYFSRMFTQYTKMNPSVFRKMHALPSI